MAEKRIASGTDQVGWFERAEDDFPFYRGQPISLSPGQWWLLLATVALGFACLTVPVPVLTSDLGVVVRTLLFPAIPLVTLGLLVGRHWRSLFRRLRLADFGWMGAFALLNLIVSTLVAMVVTHFFGTDGNVAVGKLLGQDLAERELFFLRSIPQLFGEEVLTILPFLATLHLAHDRFGLSRNRSVFVAWIGTAIVFGLLHLPSYNWNWIQCLLVIGTARLVLSLAYIKTKNIWVSTGAHIINDWVIFGVVISASSAAVSG